MDDTTKRREQKRIYLYTGKSEAEVTNRRLRSTYGIVLLKLTTGRHEASRGLSATAGLLVVVRSRVRKEAQLSQKEHVTFCVIEYFA